MKKHKSTNTHEDEINYQREREEALNQAIVWGEAGDFDYDDWQPRSTSED